MNNRKKDIKDTSSPRRIIKVRLFGAIKRKSPNRDTSRDNKSKPNLKMWSFRQNNNKPLLNITKQLLKKPLSTSLNSI